MPPTDGIHTQTHVPASTHIQTCTLTHTRRGSYMDINYRPQGPVADTVALSLPEELPITAEDELQICSS